MTLPKRGTAANPKSEAANRICARARPHAVRDPCRTLGRSTSERPVLDRSHPSALRNVNRRLTYRILLTRTDLIVSGRWRGHAGDAQGAVRGNGCDARGCPDAFGIVET